MSENLGFLTVIGQSDGSFTGGYLVLNRTGRPLEFHCTMPVAPDKMQKILYGDTLQPFICGEKIAQMLIRRAHLPILSVLTNCPAVLPIHALIETPVIYVFERWTNSHAENNTPKEKGDNEKEESCFGKPDTLLFPEETQPREISQELNESLKGFGIDKSHLTIKDSYLDDLPKVPLVSGLDTGIWQETRIGNRLIGIPETDGMSREQLTEEMKRMAQTIDLLEPFTRIQRALHEAQRAA